jgi:hypothetical protein
MAIVAINPEQDRVNVFLGQQCTVDSGGVKID